MIQRLLLSALLAIITGITYGYVHAENGKTFVLEIPTTRTDGYKTTWYLGKRSLWPINHRCINQ